MKVEMTEEQVRNTLALLNRVNVAGSEAVGVVILQQIFQRALQAQESEETPKDD